MRCNICDKALADTEVAWNSDLGSYEPCTTCLTVAMEAAYCDGFTRSDDDEGDNTVESDFDDDQLVLEFDDEG